MTGNLALLKSVLGEEGACSEAVEGNGEGGFDARDGFGCVEEGGDRLGASDEDKEGVCVPQG